MRDLVEYIAQSLVDDPDQVEVTEHGGSGRRVVNLKVAPEDMGRVIGKQGRIAQAVRDLLKVSASYQYGDRANGSPPVLTISDTAGTGARAPHDGPDIGLDEES